MTLADALNLLYKSVYKIKTHLRLLMIRTITADLRVSATYKHRIPLAGMLFTCYKTVFTSLRFGRDFPEAN